MVNGEADQVARRARGGSQTALAMGIFGASGSLIGSTLTLIEDPYLLASLAVAVSIVLLILVDRLNALLMLLVLAFINTGLLPVLFEIGEFSVRVHDVVLGALVGMLIVESGVRGTSPTLGPGLRRVVVPLATLMAYVGLTLGLVYVAFPHRGMAATASFLRLLQSACLVPLVYFALRNGREIRRFVRAFALLGVLSVALSLVEVVSGPGIFHERLRVRWLLGPNELGLVGGLVTLLGVVRQERRGWSRPGLGWILIAAGGFGLLVTKSAASTLATAVTVVAYVASRQRRDLLTLVRWCIGLIIGLALVGLVVSLFRPSDADAFLRMRDGSFVHRVILGVGGLGVFADHPVLGIGWQASAFPEVLGSPALNAWLVRVFPYASPHLFPDVLPTSVHNLYVQVASELGVVGLLLVLWLAVGIVRVNRAASRDKTGEQGVSVESHFLRWSLLFVAIWWNTNALYGGQTESLLFFSFLGAVTALEKMGGGGANPSANTLPS